MKKIIKIYLLAYKSLLLFLWSNQLAYRRSVNLNWTYTNVNVEKQTKKYKKKCFWIGFNSSSVLNQPKPANIGFWSKRREDEEENLNQSKSTQHWLPLKNKPQTQCYFLTSGCSTFNKMLRSLRFYNSASVEGKHIRPIWFIMSIRGILEAYLCLLERLASPASSELLRG